MFIVTFTDFSTSPNIFIRNGTRANMQQAVKTNSTFNTADLSQKGYPLLDTQTPRAHPELFLGKGGGVLTLRLYIKYV